MLKNQIRAISLGMVCVFLIMSDNAAVLVDTGNPGSEDKIMNKMAEAGVKLYS